MAAFNWVISMLINLIDMNNIKTLPISCCRSWAKMTELHLTSNCLRALPEELSLMESLEVLEVSSNQLFEMPPSISKCSKLRKLLASKNNISQFPQILHGLPLLEEIDLSFNALTYIFPADVPESARTVTWPLLEELNLCRNKVRELPACILQLADPSFGKLSRLHLEHNRLTSLPMIPDPSVLGKMDLFTFKLNRFIEIPDVLAGVGRASLSAFKETIPDECVWNLSADTKIPSLTLFFSLFFTGLSRGFSSAPFPAPATFGGCTPLASRTSLMYGFSVTCFI
jgi:Leucine-rich repeat (LRR) protein